MGSTTFFTTRVWFEMPHNVQRVVRDGEDGGQLALIEAVNLDRAAERFGRLVIAGGDHEIVPTATQARVRGMQVR